MQESGGKGSDPMQAAATAACGSSYYCSAVADAAAASANSGKEGEIHYGFPPFFGNFYLPPLLH